MSRFTDRGIEVLILGPREVFDSRFTINLLVWDYGEGSLQDGHVLLGMGSTLTWKPWRSLVLGATALCWGFLREALWCHVARVRRAQLLAMFSNAV